MTSIEASGKHDGSYRYMWEIEGQSDVLRGNPIEIQYNDTGFLSLKVHAFDESDNYKATFSTTLISKYVKREIRSLTDSDRNKFLNATSKIWTLSSTDGKALYGENFTSIHTFVREHAIASGDMMCDQFHEGSGFLTHHLALSNSFEASIRAIDPSVTLHYWDFTIEGQTIADAGMNPSYMLQVSPVFSDEWFGSTDEANFIQDSRWAHVSMPAVEDGDNAETPHNSYGYIRSYWNNNNATEIIRHLFDACGTEPTYKQVPTCQMHYDVLDVHSLGDFQDLSPGDGHGPMHVNIGGMYGECSTNLQAFTSKWADYLDANLTESDIEATGQSTKTFFNKWGYSGQRRVMFNKAIVGEYFHIYRSFWRSHMCAVDSSPALLVCPDTCDSDTPFESCTCTVPTLESGEMGWYNLFPCVLNSEDNQQFFNLTMSEDFMSELTYTLATSSVKEGEMLEAASPADPLFWMIHTVLERLLAAKRLTTVTSMGGNSFTKWKGSMGTVESSWLSSSYYNFKKGMNKWYTSAYTCVGHASTDNVLPDALNFTSAISSVADADGDGNITNWEFYKALDPNEATLNDYVFDNFEWSHCEGDAIEASSSSATIAGAYYGGVLKQDSFTFRQIAVLMGFLVSLVVLFTYMQVHGLKSNRQQDMRDMATAESPFSTHEYYTVKQQQQGAQYSYSVIAK
eukprot:gene25775-32266_t